MQISKPEFILTDIEGTTTSISFVADELFPYFRQNIHDLLQLVDNPIVAEAFDQTKQLALSDDGIAIITPKEIIETLNRWSLEDRKITPLKAVQGVLWNKGYSDGTLKGHVYPEVPAALKKWKESGIQLGVFSSGSIAAQKLIFGYSLAGDLTSNFSAYFDTTTGGKKEVETYVEIAKQLTFSPERILFLSDIVAELEAAENAGFQTIQLVRENTEAAWKNTVSNFDEITQLIIQ